MIAKAILFKKVQGLVRPMVPASRNAAEHIFTSNCRGWC
jgi:hypothetical protein